MKTKISFYNWLIQEGGKERHDFLNLAYDIINSQRLWILSLLSDVERLKIVYAREGVCSQTDETLEVGASGPAMEVLDAAIDEWKNIT